MAITFLRLGLFCASPTMGTGLTRRHLSIAPPAGALPRAAALAALAAAFGALTAHQPAGVIGLLAGLLLIALAFFAPVTHLMLLLVSTVVVGRELQQQYFAHFLPSDALLLTGLIRAAVVLWGERLEPRRLAAVGLMVAFMAAVLLQFFHGLRAGAIPSYAEAEARILLSFGALLIAIPIVGDPLGRIRLARGLVVVGLLLGLWGLAQWGLGIQGANNVDLGVRPTADFAVSGSGQLHGGLYGYPVAVVMSSAVLLSGACRSLTARLALFVVLLTNLMCLLLTYERTFWFTTLAGIAFVIANLERGRRIRAAAATVAAGVFVAGVLAVVAPRDFSAVGARVASSSQGAKDYSVRSRIVESDHVWNLKVTQKPLFGWGLGDFLHWGQPWKHHSPKSTWFSHNGYLWMVWKTGVVVAALLLALLVWAVALRGPPEGGAFMRAFRTGSQAALLVLLLTTVTFPSFNSLNITATMGVLVAVCFAPLARTRRLPGPSAWIRRRESPVVWGRPRPSET